MAENPIIEVKKLDIKKVEKLTEKVVADGNKWSKIILSAGLVVAIILALLITAHIRGLF